MIVEIAWLWLRFQPGSALSQWYRARFAGAGLRMRRIGIVALAPLVDRAVALPRGRRDPPGRKAHRLGDLIARQSTPGAYSVEG
jgi:hypothetical protein